MIVLGQLDPSTYVKDKNNTKQQVPEGDLAGPLTHLVAAHPSVSMGSYPNVRAGDTRYKVKVVLEARDVEALDAAATALQAAVACVTEVDGE